MASNDKKNATLGIPHGTATNRLRKLILFDLLKRHNENVCIKCSKVIEVVDDLSIEHIKPWEGISADLFWDLSNIAFTHISCNRPNRVYSPKIITPVGTAWCSGHKKALLISEFQKNITKDDGLQSECRECRTNRDTRVNHTKKSSGLVV